MSRHARAWWPAAAAAVVIGGTALLPVFNQETERPLLSSDNAPPARDEDAGPARARRPAESSASEPELDRDPLFTRSGRNPGSAAHPNAPGRVRDDAPAWFEINHLDPPMPERSAFALEPRQPLPPVDPDPRFHDVVRMSDDSRADDFPAIVTNPSDRGDVWMIYVSYSGRRDELRLARRDSESGTWGPWNPVPGVTGDVWRPSLEFDGAGRLWIVWAQQEPFDAAFDLYARWFDGERWGPLERVTRAPEGDFDQQLARAGDGTLHLVWQGFRDGQSDIFYSRLDGSSWSAEQRLSPSEANDWAPAIAIDSKGTAQVFWDTYDRGDYDVVGCTVVAGRAGAVAPVAASDFLEARPSVAIDREDRVWVAYEIGEEGWGKDNGRLIDKSRQPGSALNAERQVEVRVRGGDGRFTAAKPEISKLFATVGTAPREGEEGNARNALVSAPQLAVDEGGRVHLVVRAQARRARVQYWQPYVTTMTDRGWSEPALVPFSVGRLSMRTGTAPAEGGGLWLAWARDNWPSFAVKFTYPEETVEENVYAGRFEPEAKPGLLTGEPEPPPFADRAPGHAEESADVARLRGWRTRVDGRELQILRGDTHRHTEFSLDGRGRPDGSILDFYRYVLDAAALDFGNISDHQYGAEREYWWWLEEKLADMFFAPERYVSMFGYERSVSFPSGHRNVIHAERGTRPVTFFGRTSYTDIGWPNLRFLNTNPQVAPDDTQLLYEEVRKSGGITIPHTTATGMGTNWSDNDAEVEPLVEIFQGDRYSYEQPGAPLTNENRDLDPQLGGPQAEGFVSNALAKGFKLGFIASSDHASTHLSYAMVYATDRSRGAVLDAMRARRTYAATDNIVLEFWIGDEFMGGELRPRGGKVPEIRVRAVGTRPFLDVEILRNGQPIHRSSPGRVDVDVQFRDLEPSPGTSYYYARLTQEDGQTAWSSPIWVEMAPTDR